MDVVNDVCFDKNKLALSIYLPWGIRSKNIFESNCSQIFNLHPVHLFNFTFPLSNLRRLRMLLLYQEEISFVAMMITSYIDDR